MKRGFHTIMSVPVFILAFIGTLAVYAAPWVLLLATLWVFVEMWTENPLGMSLIARDVASLVLAVLFIAFLFAGFAMNDRLNN